MHGKQLHIARDMSYENKYMRINFLMNTQLDKLSNFKPKSAKRLSFFVIIITESLAALRTLRSPVHYWDLLLLHQLTKLLDLETREGGRLEDSTITFSAFLQFEEFLVGRTRVMENMTLHLSLTTHTASPNMLI